MANQKQLWIQVPQDYNPVTRKPSHWHNLNVACTVTRPLNFTFKLRLSAAMSAWQSRSQPNQRYLVCEQLHGCPTHPSTGVKAALAEALVSSEISQNFSKILPQTGWAFATQGGCFTSPHGRAWLWPAPLTQPYLGAASISQHNCQPQLVTTWTHIAGEKGKAQWTYSSSFPNSIQSHPLVSYTGSHSPAFSDPHYQKQA